MLKLAKAGKGRFPLMQQRPRTWLVAIIILIGAFMRLHDLAAVPPSAGYDVAYYGLDALDILQGHFPIYLESNFGREAMFSYLVAFLYATIGVGDFAIHLAAAFVGILTLPATYILMEELLRNEEEQLIRRFAPLLATACLAVMYWHVVWSRFGVRAILAPMFITVNLFSLLRALRTHRRVYFVAAGLTAGLSLYTYQIGQLVPFLVVAIVVIDWIHRRRQRPFVAHVKSLGWLVAAAVSSALPLVIYMRRNPETFNQRVRDVSVLDTTTPLLEQLRTLLAASWRVVRFLTVEGDVSLVWSADRTPGLNGLLLLGLVLGCLSLLWYWRRPAAQMVVTWMLIMLLPAVLADFGPISKRALGALPVLVAIIALGWLAPFTFALSRLPESRQMITGTATILTSVGLLFTFATSYRAYFVIWANNPDKDGAFDPHLSEMGHFIAGLPEGELIYLSADAPNHPNMLLHSRLRTAGDDVRGYNGWQCFVFPQVIKRPTTYVLSEQHSVNWLEQIFPAGELRSSGLSNVYGYDDYFVAYQISAGQQASFQPQYDLQVNWSEKIDLKGYDLPREIIAPGEIVELTLYWMALQEMDTQYIAFVHLLGAQNPQTGNPIWGQHDSEPCQTFYPTTVWHRGEVIRDPITLTPSPDIPPGDYQLSIGFYSWPDLQRLPVGEADAFLLHAVQIGDSDG